MTDKTGEVGDQAAPKAPTYRELQVKYDEEAQREYGGTPPWGGEREQRLLHAEAGVDMVWSTLMTHRTLSTMTGGKSGILSEVQLQAIDDWHVENMGILAYDQAVRDLGKKVAAVGLVEGFVADIEATANAGLEIFEQPEA